MHIGCIERAAILPSSLLLALWILENDNDGNAAAAAAAAAAADNDDDDVDDDVDDDDDDVDDDDDDDDDVDGDDDDDVDGDDVDGDDVDDNDGGAGCKPITWAPPLLLSSRLQARKPGGCEGLVQPATIPCHGAGAGVRQRKEPRGKGWAPM